MISKALVSERFTASAFTQVSLTHIAANDDVHAATKAIVDTALNQLPDDEIPAEQISALASAMEKAGIAVHDAGQYAAQMVSHITREYTNLCHLLL